MTTSARVHTQMGSALASPVEPAPPARRKPSVVRFALTRFLVAAVVSLVVVSVATVLALRAIARDQALEDAKDRGERIATGTVAPFVTAAVLAGDEAAFQRLDDAVKARISDGSVTRIKVWDADGTVVYSDEPQLIGRDFPPEPWMDEIRRTGEPTAEIEYLDDAENVFEDVDEPLVEVYAQATAASGDDLVFEAYFPMDDLRRLEQNLLRSVLPIGLGALVILLLVQLPAALRLARHVDEANEAKERLLRQAVAASDLERRRIARDLHDEVIQDLAGASYALEAAQPHVSGAAAPLVDRVRDILRRDVATLRGMLTELYPADLDSLGLPGAIERLADPLRAKGTEVHVGIADIDVDPTTATLLYRVAREALVNAEKHAAAQHVHVSLTCPPERVVLAVRDDGRGFDPAERPRGHLGLRLIHDTVREAGGEVHLTSSPGEGTSVRVVLPCE